MIPKIIFSDVDGTLINRQRQFLPGTLYAISELQKKGILFVIASGRCPTGIFPLMDDHGLQCPIIAFNGGTVMDSSRQVLYSEGLDREIACDVSFYIEKDLPECVWNIFSTHCWITQDADDPKVISEKELLRTEPTKGTVQDARCLPAEETVGKVLGMCAPEHIRYAEENLKQAFPGLSIAASNDHLLEIVPRTVSKSNAVREICRHYGVSQEETAAFGDNFNDLEMLMAVGQAYLMGNAPEEMKKRVAEQLAAQSGQAAIITDTNDNEGIYKALVREGLIKPMG